MCPQLQSMLPVACLSAGMGTMFIERPSKAYKSEHRVTGTVDRKDSFAQKLSDLNKSTGKLG